ncbi:MAG: hypothetical protein ACO37F_10290 [Pirellulales bacterium]
MSPSPASTTLPPPAADWLAGLRAFVAQQRQQPRPSQRRLPPTFELAAEAELIAAHLRGWLPELPQLLAAQGRSGGSRPAIAITTSIAGLQAAETIVEDPQLQDVLAGCCFVTESEYRFWCKERPDANYQLHINHWAWLKTQVPVARAREFVAYPLPAGSRHWLFRHGLAGLGAADHHSCRLYAWDGEAAHLLTESFREGVQGLP